MDIVLRHKNNFKFGKTYKLVYDIYCVIISVDPATKHDSKVTAIYGLFFYRNTGVIY